MLEKTLTSEELKEVDKHLESSGNTQPDLSKEEIEEWFGESTDDIYYDHRVPLVRRAMALIEFWHELNKQIDTMKEGYHLAKKWKDEELKEQYIKKGGPLIKRQMILEEDMKVVLPLLKNTQFLSTQQAVLLPKWMLELLDIKYQA